MALTNIAKVLQHAEIPSHIYKSDADRAEMKRAVRTPCMSCPTVCRAVLTTCTRWLPIEGGDAEWRKLAHWKKCKTICALAALVNFLTTNRKD